MYVKRSDMVACGLFSGVDDALCMLRIAEEFLFQDCMDACMEYLSMLCSWTLAEEASIRLTLSSLQVCDIHRDLARCLSLPQGVPWDEPTLVLRRMLVHLLQSCEPAMKGLDESKPIPEASICMVWKTHWDVIKLRTKPYEVSKYWNTGKQEKASVTLLMLFDRLLTLGAADAVVRLFAWDEGASYSVIGLFKDILDYGMRKETFCSQTCDIVARILQSVADNKVLLLQTDRLALIKTWLPLCATEFIATDQRQEISSTMMRLIGALPIVDRGEVYKYCMEPQLKAPDELVTSLQPWYDMVRELHTQLGSRSSIALVGKDFCS